MLYTTPNRETRERLSSTRSGGTLTSASHPSIYVLDRDLETRSKVCQWLTASGHTVLSFATPESLLGFEISPHPSCLILEHDLSLSDTGMLVARRFMEDAASSLIFLGESTDLSLVVKAVRSGATEFLAKPVAPDLLLTAVQNAFSELRQSWSEVCKNRELQRRYGTLTPREREILTFVVCGYLNKQTAYELGTSEVTVRIHRGQIMRKMAADSLADLVRSAVRIGVAQL